MLRDDALLARVEADYRTAGLSPRQVAVLAFVERLTRRPAAAKHEHVAALREHDLDDRDILHIVEVAAYYAYVNRIADGLGVELEDSTG